FEIYLYEDATSLGFFRMHSTGQIQILDDITGYEDIMAYSADQWYVVAIDFSCAADTYKIDVYDHTGGSWLGWSGNYTLPNACTTNVNKLLIFIQDNGTAQTAYMDTITPTDPTAAAPAAEVVPEQIHIFR
ncbi:unnamed protein product, partial [marine sediment metagenome]